MNARPFLLILLFFALLGLAACVPVPEVTVEEAPEVSASSSATATVSPGNKLDQPSPEGDTQPAESESPPEGDQFLIVPTLAPTATPGVIYAVVEHVVEVANLNETQFWGLSAADWINLGISLFLVWLTFILLSRLIFAVLKIIALRTPTPYDEIYLDSIRHYLRWLLGMIILYIAIARLQFLSPQLKQWLGQIVAVVIIWLVIMCLWKLVDIFSLWYHDKVKDQDERSSKDAALLLADRAVRTRGARCPAACRPHPRRAGCQCNRPADAQVEQPIDQHRGSGTDVHHGRLGRGEIPAEARARHAPHLLRGGRHSRRAEAAQGQGRALD